MGINIFLLIHRANYEGLLISQSVVPEKMETPGYCAVISYLNLKGLPLKKVHNMVATRGGLALIWHGTFELNGLLSSYVARRAQKTTPVQDGSHCCQRGPLARFMISRLTESLSMKFPSSWVSSKNLSMQSSILNSECPRYQQDISFHGDQHSQPETKEQSKYWKHAGSLLHRKARW